MSARRFNRYPACKDSGVEWLGEIPVTWEVKKWRYCCHVTEGQVAPDDDRFRERILIAPNHIESGTGRIFYTETAEDQGAISGKYVVAPGDIIYSKIRPALNKVCIAAGDWLCSADMYPVAITEKRLQPRFLLYFMLSEPFVRLMVDESMRVAMPKVNREQLATCPLIIADPEEQRAIAAFLDRETARIDALVAKKERLIELLHEQRTALITRAVTKGLDPNVPMKDSGVEWLGEIPAHWEVRRLKFLLAAPLKYGANEAAELDDPELPRYVRITDIDESDGLRDDTFKSLPVDVAEEYLLRDGDLLFARSGATAGKTFLYRRSWGICAYAGYLIRARLDTNRASPEFVRYFTASTSYWQWLSAAFIQATIQNVSAEKYASLVMPQPPHPEQRTIAGFLDRETARIDTLVAKVREAIERLGELRTALISAAVTGKIDVRGTAGASAAAGEEVSA